MSDATAIEVRGLVRRYGYRRALDGVDLDVRRGGAVALYGPNGAGKTTLLRVLGTGLRPDRGTVAVLGFDRARDAAAIRRHVGILGHAPGLYRDLDVRTNVRFFARLQGVERPNRAADAWIERLGLAHRAGDPVRVLSRGLLQRVAIARAWVHDPDVLLLDEPFEGLDPVATRMLSDELARARAENRTVVLATHDVELGARLADGFVILGAGRVAERGDSPPDPVAIRARLDDLGRSVR